MTIFFILCVTRTGREHSDFRIFCKTKRFEFLDCTVNQHHAFLGAANCKLLSMGPNVYDNSKSRQNTFPKAKPRHIARSEDTVF